ncbi:hypothetical protein [Dysgonomonas reticulitermitis]
MTERFYDIKHLTTGQLRELFSSYRKQGWVDFEYYELSGSKPPVLADAEIILNIQAENEENYFVFMLGHEDEKDGVMVGFGLTYHEEFSAFLHLPTRFLDELVEKYGLENSHEEKDYTIAEFLVEDYKGKPLN